MSVKIVTDSAADLTQEYLDQLIRVPLSVSFGDNEYLDGVTITHKEFYEKLIESDELPRTSQATPTAFEEVFEQAKKDGDEVVVLTLSSKLSGTYQSAMIAAADYDNVYVVDTLTVAISEGILAVLALQLAKEGMDAKSIAARIEEEKENVCLVAMLDTLEYLKKGGRISAAAAFAGGVLSIKPVITVRDGVVEMLGKARGSKQGNNLLVKEIEKAGGVDFSKPLLLGYTGLTDNLLNKYIEDSSFLWKENISHLETTTIGSAIGTHVGPGAIAVAFFKK